MKIIGIDPSLTATAVCIWDTELPDDQPVVMRVFTSKPAEGVKARIERYQNLVEDVAETIIIHNARNNSVVFLEGYSATMKGNALFSLCEFGGLLRQRFVDLPKEVIEVPPTSLKKFVCGTGNAKKELMIGHVCKRWGHLFETSDEADAFSLAMLGERYVGLAECDNEAQRQVIAKLKNPVKKSRKKKSGVE